MTRKMLPLFVAIAIIVSMSLISVSAHNAPATGARAAAQTALACADKTYLEAMGKDLQEMGNTLKGFKMDDTPSIAQLMLQIAGARQKYEDMTDVPSDCIATHMAVIIAYANISDLLALAMAVKADPTNAAEYAKAIAGQSERIGKAMQQVLIQAGLATPAP
jgi:hypothetical protein